LWWFLLACAGESDLPKEGEDRPDVGVLIADLTRELEGSDRESLVGTLDRALPELGQDIELDELLLRATLMHGSAQRMTAIQRSRGGLFLDFTHPVVEQVVIRARRQEADWLDLEEAIQDCELLDRRPTRGLQSLHEQAASSLAEVAHRLGAVRVALGRPVHMADPEPITGQGDLLCRELRLLDDDRLPERLPRSLHVAITDGSSDLYISIKKDSGAPWAYVSNSAKDAERLLGASLWWDTAGASRDAELLPLFGEGLWAR
jgi:hypothetical protein